MRRPALGICLLAIALVALPATTLARPERTVDIDLSVQRGEKGEEFTGPVDMRLINLNRLRYEITVGSEITISDGPDLSPGGFIPVFPKTPKVEPSEKSDSEAVEFMATPCSDTPCEIGKIRDGLSAAAAAVRDLVNSAESSQRTLSSALDRVTQLAQQSNAILSMPEGATLLAARASSLQQDGGEVAQALSANWPKAARIDGARRTIDDLMQRLATLPEDQSDFQTWKSQSASHAEEFSTLKKRGDEISKALKSLEGTSDQRKAFDDSRRKLTGWDTVLATTSDAASYEQVVSTSCEQPFFKNKSVTYTVQLRDRLESDPKKAVSKQGLATVECRAAGSITGGVGFSRIPERDYAFVSSTDGSGNLTSVIGLEDDSETTVSPVFLLNVRLANFDSRGAYAFHFGAGTALDVDHQDSGVRLGYILAPSFSFKNTVFVTLGAKISRINRLAGGFQIGDAVPMDLTEPPVTRDWDADYFFGVTFRMK